MEEKVSPEEKKKRMIAYMGQFPCTKKDVVYAHHSGVDLLATIYAPIQRPNHLMPAVIYVHGGGFVGGDRDHFEGTATMLTKDNFVGICIAYRFAKMHPFPAAVQDVKAAIRYVRKNASLLGVDPNRIAICGSSAGGNLAAMGAYASGEPAFDVDSDKEISDVIQVAILYCGIYDFCPPINKMVNIREARNLYLGGEWPAQEATYKKASPVNYVKKGSCPTLLLHGDADGTVDFVQSTHLQKVLQENGVTVELKIASGEGHKAYDFLKPHFDIANQQTRDFLLKYL